MKALLLERMREGLLQKQDIEMTTENCPPLGLS